MKRICTSILVIFLLTSISSFAVAERSEMKFEGDGYTSPEAAVEAYLEYMNAGNVNGMISTFAIETFVENYDTEAYLTSILSASRKMYLSIPAANQYLKEILVAQRLGDIAQTLMAQYLLYNCRDTDFEKLGEAETITLFSEEERYKYLSLFRYSGIPEWVGNCEEVSFHNPLLFLQNSSSRTSEDYYRGVDRMLKYYACDAYEDVISTFEVNGEDYALIMGCGKYNGKWYIVSMGGVTAPFLGLTSLAGGLVPLSDI